jgi:hypothetical protein
MEMPLRKLQEIIIDYVQYLYKAGRHLALQCSVDYPYKGPVFAFQIKSDRLVFTDNTQVNVTLQDGREIMESIDHRRFDKPERNKVEAAFLKFEHWQNRILENRDHTDPDRLERELEIMTRKLLPLAVEMLKSTAESYSLPDPFRESGQDYWTHPLCGLSSRIGMLESGESVPAKIQLKIEQLNDLLRESERRVVRARAGVLQPALPRSPEASQKVIRLLQEIIADYAGTMLLAGQCKNADSSTASSGSSQYPPVPVVKDGTNPFPVTDSPAQEATGDSAILKAKARNLEISDVPSEDEDKDPQSNRRNERMNLRKAKTARSSLLTAAERRMAVQAYIVEVFEKTEKRITRTDIWKSARYKTRTEFERWQRNDPKATRSANERFTRLLMEKPHLK